MLEAEAPRPETTPADTVLVAETAPPKPLHKPQIALSQGDCEQYRDIIDNYDWDVEIAMKIASHESGCDTSIVNDNPATGDYSIGIFQINIFGANAKYRPSEQALKDPATNIAYAYSLWKSSGFQSQWSVCRSVVRCI